MQPSLNGLVAYSSDVAFERREIWQRSASANKVTTYISSWLNWRLSLYLSTGASKPARAEFHVASVLFTPLAQNHWDGKTISKNPTREVACRQSAFKKFQVHRGATPIQIGLEAIFSSSFWGPCAVPSFGGGAITGS